MSNNILVSGDISLLNNTHSIILLYLYLSWILNAWLTCNGVFLHCCVGTFTIRSWKLLSPLSYVYMNSHLLSSLPPPTGESCPENGRSPGSVSTQHSSPRSDFTYGNSTSTTQAPMGNTATSDGTSTPNTQPSDVIINRKESEGFGFVIISSLNRPEAAATNSKSSDWFSGVL